MNYETVELYALNVTHPLGASLLVEKIRFAGKVGSWDKSTIRYYDQITLREIPDEAHEYVLGSRSAPERYRVKTAQDSGIVNDPDNWGIEHGGSNNILNLAKRIVIVRVETVKIEEAVPPLVIAD